MRNWRSWLVVLAVIVSAGCARPVPAPVLLDIATTTSVVNSGLLSVLLPQFDRETGVAVRVHAAGSGRALEMLHDRVVDLVISHAPQAEARMLASHPAWHYRKIASNQFLIVGPAADPARVRDAMDVVEAFTRIAESGQYFLSRGDGSGTHERESELWSAAVRRPGPDRLLISGAGMGATLRQASERAAYTLSDDATFRQLGESLALASLFAGDPRLVNAYAVVYLPEVPASARFAEWLSEGAGREAIGAYAIDGFRPFTVWPAGCAADRPLAAPCPSP